MNVIEFKEKHKINGSDKVTDNQNTSLLDILSYFLTATSKSGCTDVSISEVSDVNSVIVTSPTCSKVMKTILDGFVNTYQKYKFSYEQSGNYFTLKLPESNQQQVQTQTTKTTNQPTGEFYKNVAGKLMSTMPLGESKKLKEEINRIKELL
jgi:hypothetical protein